MPDVGTRIRVLVDRAFSANVRAGDTGLIVQIAGNSYGVRMDILREGSSVTTRQSASINDDYDWWLRREDFEVIENSVIENSASIKSAPSNNKLRFVESRDGYSVYARPDGTEVFLADGHPLRYLVEFDIDWANREWQKVRYSGSYSWRFLDDLRERITEPDVVDDLSFCEYCNRLAETVDLNPVAGDGYACPSCVRHHYRQCNDCGEYDQTWSHTLGGDSVCEGCVENYSFCEDCGGYYFHDDYDDHDHSPAGCDCESPATRFAVRNDGQGMLQNDERVTITLPAGTVDEEGIVRIRQYLRRHVPDDEQTGYNGYAVAELVGDLGREWQTGKGNFTKRLSRAAYQKLGMKLTPEVISQVGCIASDHSRAINFAIETTRNLNMSAADFFHEDSCWWQSYSESRCALKSSGGFGLRTFGELGDVRGRAWVMPLKRRGGRDRLVPTFNTETPDAFVVFNGYGDLEGYSAARIVSHMAGMTYRKIDFYAEPMFINGESAYLIAPEDIAAGYTDGSLSLSSYTASHSNLYNTEKTESELVDA